MLRQYLGEFAIACFVLAAFFFSLIFLIGVADNTKTSNSIQNQVPLQQSEVARWGQIPGDLDYFYSRTATIYSRQTFSDTKYNMNISGPYEFIVNRSFQGTAWAPTKSCIDYSMLYGYSGVTETELETINLMPNLEALSVWYQKTHKPDYWLAWQALTQVSDLMFKSNMLARYYAYNAYEFIFKDSALVYQGVLAGLSTENQQAVYTDPLFGLDSTDKIAFWVIASENGDQSTSWQAILTYYSQKGIDLSTAIYQIIGDQAIITMIWKEQYQVLLNEPSFEQKVTLDEQYMTKIQWGQNSVLGNQELMMKGVPALQSIGEPEFDSVFLAYPEFGTFLQLHDRLDLIMTASQAGDLLEQTTENYVTLLNPDNMRAFFKQYQEKQFTNLQTRFGFTSPAQCDYFYQYLGYLVENQLLNNGPIENIAMGGLVERTLNQTYSALNQTFHLEVVTRNLAQQINASTGQLSCQSFLQPVSADNYTEICANYDFSNVTQIKSFVNATWYKNNTDTNWGGYYSDVLMNATNLSAAQMTQLFDHATQGTFGWYVYDNAGRVAVKYSCKDTANCTGTELIDKQWGQSYVTLNPLAEDPVYTPTQNTTMNWGSYPVYGCEVAVEYSYWMTQGSAVLSEKTVGKIQSNSIDLYGLLNLYNTQRFMSFYFTNNAAEIGKFNAVLGLEAQFPENAMYMVQGWLFEGAWRNYTSDELVYGWDSTLADKANGGDYWEGADFNVETWMTPIFTESRGPMANTRYGLFSGSFTPDNVSGYRLNNQQAYLNKLIPIWNGTYFTQTPQQPNGAISNADSMWFNAVSNGMQFPPNQGQDTVKVYNDRTIQIESFDYYDTTQVPTSVLDVHEYRSEWNGGVDVGFTFNMPFFEQSLDCGDCTNTTIENKQAYEIAIQGKQYKHAAVNSINNIILQPDAGFTQKRNKESTMVMLMSLYTNGTNNLQPSALQAMPLPELMPLVGMHVPIYDMKETLYAGQDQYLDMLSYISDNSSKVRTITIWMIIFTSVFFVAGLVLAVILKKNQTSGRDDSEVQRAELQEQDGLIYRE